MVNTISYNEYIDGSPDDNIWLPIPEAEYDKFDSLINNVRDAFENGTKKEKGNSMESLMTYIYKRFKNHNLFTNQRTSDNEIDHRLEFIDGMVPTFINEHVGLKLIGESKNHKRSIGSRDVSNLDELLRSQNCKLGIFSSYKSFSRGSSMWFNAEGKRRKLALWNQHKKVIIGFTIDELSTLKKNNFYTMLKQKHRQIIDELDDDHTDNDLKLPYQDRLYEALIQMNQNGIIDSDTLLASKSKIESKYGQITSD